MSIYTKENKALPYVYRCTERDTGRFYIGYRFKNKVPAQEDFGVHYFTSNEYVKNNFDKFDFEIIKEFADRKSAFEYETKLISETKSDKQINSDKNKYKKRYESSEIYFYCKYPGCGKYINSSIKKFCCKSHAATYSAKKKNGTLGQPNKDPKTYYERKKLSKNQTL
jgi:hypothetical protein